MFAIVGLLIPVYRARNHSLIEPADLSTQSLAAMRQALESRPFVRQIVLVDDPHATVKLDDAFGALAADAVCLFVSPDALVRTTDSRTSGEAAGNNLMVFELHDGRLVQEEVRTNGSPADANPSHSD